MSYVVSWYSCERLRSMDDKGSTNDCEFASLDDARAYYDAIDIRHLWIVEKDNRPGLPLMEHTVFAKELYEYDERAEEYGDSFEYDEYTIDDYRREND